ncbi:uncharacterized protein LOC131253486 [Magnolia sinica]|uniref:uncharacterized protein LOC131253486 n=1 Tax=Magnolia sinica TaxID=86752 RepID=UPI0026581AB9|nr:uncharacterized protein LOC131253486 [Magnolia sinica]XP_058110492.1 uncharacterized protein LOC131253486 [Magnolia sinica]
MHLCFMGKSVPSPTKLQNFIRLTSERLNSPKSQKPRSKIQYPPQFSKPLDSSDRTAKKMDCSERRDRRAPLADVVSDCVKRWFQDTLKEAKAGDSGMQVLVGQMYYSGYGVARDVQKGKAWITKASKSRSSVWKVSDKHPGYNASDSDSDESKGDLK